MKTGETVTDRKGRVYQAGPLLGRGLWGKCYGVRDEDGTELVLKLPLEAKELSGKDRLAKACRSIIAEQAAFLESQRQAHCFVGLQRMIELEDGTPALLLHKAATSFERRLSGGTTLEESLRTLLELCGRLAEVPDLPLHGALKPQNVLIDSRGQILMADPVTPTLRRHYTELLQAHPGETPYVAPETRLAAGEPPMGRITDTYAIAMMVLRTVHTGSDGKLGVDLPMSGLTKAQVVAFKDALVSRLKTEVSNPRFHTRLADRCGAVTNRALSRELSPSPPYRFSELGELRRRLEEVWALIQPTITHVGRLILNRPPGEDSFSTDEDVVIAVTVGCSSGVDDHTEIGCGIAVFDADSGERIAKVPCSYTVDRHPSGRFRFKFHLSDLEPGAYRLRIAFTIHESGHEPAVAEAAFGVLAAAGYVPPRGAPEPQPIPLERRPNTAVTRERTNPDLVVDEVPEPVAATPRIAAPQLIDEDVEAAFLRVATGGSGPHEVRPEAPEMPLYESRYDPEGPVPIPLHPGGRGVATRSGAIVEGPPPQRPVSRGPTEERPTRPSIPSNVVAEASVEAPSDLPQRDTEPNYRSLGKWTELPLPGADIDEHDAAEDLFLADRTDIDPSLDDLYAAEQSTWSRVAHVIGSDAYRIFIAGALMLIIVLLFALLALD